MRLRFLYSWLFFMIGLSASAPADLIVFSFNRPMQLNAFLESTTKHVTGIRSTSVIYRITDNRYESGYDLVKQAYPLVKFIKQGSEPYKDFKPLLIKTFDEGAGTHIIFAVDDIMVLQPVDLTWCARCMDEHDAFGFYLRLGKNIVRNYTIQQPCKVPEGQEIVARPEELHSSVSKDAGIQIFSWKFSDGAGDWAISHSVDMTLFRKADIGPLIKTLEYYNPNTFEGWMINSADLSKKGICFPSSKIVNVPLNIVQERTTHRHMNLASADELLDELLAGYKIDITSFDGMIPDAPHMEWIPRFVPQKTTSNPSSILKSSLG